MGDPASQERDETGTQWLNGEPYCSPGCGSLQWTVERYAKGVPVHKHACPYRVTPFCQSHENGCPGGEGVRYDFEKIRDVLYTASLGRPLNHEEYEAYDALRRIEGRLATAEAVTQAAYARIEARLSTAEEALREIAALDGAYDSAAAEARQMAELARNALQPDHQKEPR